MLCASRKIKFFYFTPIFTSNFDQHIANVLEKKNRCQRDIEQLERQIDDIETKISLERDRLGIVEDMDHVLQVGITRFNHKAAKKGIAYLKEHKYFSDGGTAEEVAQFLFDNVTHDYANDGVTQSALIKSEVGEYLGEGKEFNIEVLRRFADLHDFSSNSFLTALRTYLWGFKLPGESQKIDRIMECFAKRFCHANPTLFRHEDGCFLLAFSTIMLNTSLHNPSAGRNMSLEAFKSQIRGIDHGPDEPEHDLPQDLVEEVYHSIDTEAFKIPDDELGFGYTFTNPDKRGFLGKLGGTYQVWEQARVLFQCVTSPLAYLCWAHTKMAYNGTTRDEVVGACCAVSTIAVRQI
eukprot:m.14621 g.14621  ORF g.14621 m.14621 type:complete len:350 (+) comp10485_c0_seq4:353-1402(+)